MGFFDSLASEAGKKTGKAIGNALFGDKAADLTIQGAGNGANVNNSNDIEEKLRLQKQNIELEAQIREKEKNQKMLDDLLLLEFDGESIANNIKIMTKLSSMIDLWIKDKNLLSFYEVAITKFDTGLLICQTIDANNTMVAVMTSKKENWNRYLAEQKEQEEAEKRKVEEDALKAKENAKKIMLYVCVGIVVLNIILLIVL